MADHTRWRDLQRLADYACRRFRLKKVSIKPITHPKARHMGLCGADGVIELRVHRLGRPNKPLKWRTLVRTLAHELAHLVDREWADNPVPCHSVRHSFAVTFILAFWKQHHASSALLPSA